MSKLFLIPAHEIKSVAPGHGSCLASHRITVDGMKVGFMYRETPDDEGDSGWRFFSGDESTDYVNDPAHFSLYDVNTIANYDSLILALLDSPLMSAFKRDRITGAFAAVPFPEAGLN